MASAPKSRWADTAEDAAFEAKRRKEKEEKKRQKAAEKLRKQAQAAAAAAAAAAAKEADHGDDDARPNKRRKLTPEPRGKTTTASTTTATTTTTTTTTATTKITTTESKLLRFVGGSLPGPCRSVDSYDKLNDIEEGAYGWVARGRDLKTGEVVALKRLKTDPADRSGLPVTGLREIQLLRDCSHRNIVGLREVVLGETGEADGGEQDNEQSQRTIYLVLDFVEHDLKSILEEMPQPFLASEVKTLLGQLAAGVAYLHGRWILHRDLKTSNLLLTNRGQLKIADFGMARYEDDDDNHHRHYHHIPIHNNTVCRVDDPLVVTLWYRAPELLLGARRYGRPVDLWSVGCVFAELLTREPLLQGSNEADQLLRIFALRGPPTDANWPGFRRLPHARALKLPDDVPNADHLRRRFPLLTAAGCDLLGSLLALDPDRRPAAAQVLEHEYFRQDPRPKQEAMFPTFPSKAGQERRRRRATPNAPVRGGPVADLGAVDLAGIFSGRDREERGAGFSLRMV